VLFTALCIGRRLIQWKINLELCDGGDLQITGGEHAAMFLSNFHSKTVVFFERCELCDLRVEGPSFRRQLASNELVRP
jgi:hypothetical protein